MAQACLDAQVLGDYLAGRLSSDESDSIESHLKHCPRCQSLGAQLSASGDSLLKVIQQSPPRDAVDDERELASALSAIGAFRAAGEVISDTLSAANVPEIEFIGDYQILERLREGGMGTVYLARHRRLDKPVALKLLKADRKHHPEAISRFEREMRAVGKLEHPHIVRALDAREEDGVHFLVMEHVNGVDLDRLIRRLGPLAIPDACEVVRQAALGLHHAHENHLVHRDVKPSNLMLTTEGQVKVLDLGLAHLLGPIHQSAELTRDSQVLGTLLYMAPEQFSRSGRVDRRSDIYSLGVTFYELLVGSLPPRRDVCGPLAPDIAMRRVDVPEQVCTMLQKMLAAAPSERFDSMQSLVEILASLVEGADLALLIRRFSTETSAAGRTDAGWRSTPPPLPGHSRSQRHARTAVASTTAPVAVSIEPHKSIPRRRRMSRIAILAAICALFLVGAAVGIVALWDGEPRDPQGAAAQLPPLGNVLIETSDRSVSPLVPNLLKRGAISATHGESGQRYTLSLGKQQLPPGKYELNVDFPGARLAHTQLTVERDKTVTLWPTVENQFNWLFPRIPDQPGAFTDYYGTLQFTGFPEVGYTVTLRALGEDPQAGAPWWWISVEIRTEDSDGYYTEIAHLLIDRQRWDNEQRLEIKEGWLEAKSEAIKARLTAGHPASALESYYTTFIPEDDTIPEIAQERRFRLPAGRLGVHDVLALVFGDETVTASGPASQKIRKKLAELRRQLDLQPRTTTVGEIPCLVASASVGVAPFALGYELCRNDEKISFGLVQIEVTSPIVKATLKEIRNGPGGTAPQHFFTNGLAALRARAAICEKLPREPDPFTATLPQHGGDALYTGELSLGLLKLAYEARVKALGTVLVNGRPHRWVEVDVESWPLPSEKRSREIAYVLVDEQKYNEREFVVRQGWIEYRDEVFPFHPANGELSMEDSLHVLDMPLPRARVSGHDVLTLLFDARSSSRLDDLRRQISTEFVKGGWHRQYEPEKIPLLHGGFVHGEVWKSPPSGTIYYRITRSPEIPFDFMRVHLRVSGIELITDLRDYKPGGTTTQFDPTALQRRAALTAGRIREKEHENFRVWTWTDREGEHKKYAEFGGVVNDSVLLRNEGQTKSVPLERLTSEDRDWIQVGRYWTNFEGKRLVDSEGKVIERARYWHRIDNTVWLRTSKDKPPIRVELDLLSERDKDWIRLFETASGRQSPVRGEERKPAAPRRKR